jgi:hypothetical protein
MKEHHKRRQCAFVDGAVTPRGYRHQPWSSASGDSRRVRKMYRKAKPKFPGRNSLGRRKRH